MSTTLKVVSISARESHVYNRVARMIKHVSPETRCVPFEDVLQNPDLIDEVDFIFTVGGDGSVAWAIDTFFKRFGSVSRLKPVVPVIQSSSVGYLKQMDLDEEKFVAGLRRILDGKYVIKHRTVLEAEVEGQRFLAVNEVFLHCEPHLGKFKVSMLDGSDNEFKALTEVYADGAMVVTSIGSTGWGLSHHGLISLTEDALELLFVGGSNSSANFLLPRRRVKISLQLKNSSVTPGSVTSYNAARRRMGLSEDPTAADTLRIVYGSRLVIDGKVCYFGVHDLEISQDLSVPFVVMEMETEIEKARKLTAPCTQFVM